VHILIADSFDTAEMIACSARLAWPACAVGIADTGADALEAFADLQPDLVILDVGIPHPDGYEVCQQIRAVSDVPILILTERSAIMDKVRGFDLGVDDYLTKPFDRLELIARMRALVRLTSKSTTDNTTLSVGNLTLDDTTHQVRLQGEQVSLTSTEYRLLELLVRHAGQVLPHQQLLEQLWGEAYRTDIHYLKVFVRRLRQKLDDDATHPRYIQTEWGIGYRFMAPQSALR